jgi:hypothetical protein
MLMKVKFWRWILGFGVVGLLVPAALMLHANLTHTLFGDRELLLWPGSIALLSTEDMPKPQQFAVLGEALFSNVLLYAALGAGIWPFRRLIRRCRTTRADNPTMPPSAMVDVEARKQAADLVQKFRDGVITNDEFRDSWPRRKNKEQARDRALGAINSMLWFTYSDTRSHKLTLTSDLRSLYDRCYLFLKSDIEYKWQRDEFVASWVQAFRVFTLGLSSFFDRPFARRLAEQPPSASQISGPDAIWPFYSAEELAQERERSSVNQ